jgi:hypothetical protein
MGTRRGDGAIWLSRKIKRQKAKIKRQKYGNHLAPLLALKKIRADLLPFAF